MPTALSPEEIERFVTTQAEPALAAPVVVQLGKEEATVSRNQLSRLLTVTESPEHTLSLVMDEPGLVDVVRGAAGDAERRARDATVRLREGRPQVVAARTGRELDQDDLVTQVTGALTGTGDARTVKVALTTVQPEVTDDDAASWSVDEVMSEFTSQFPTGATNAARTENIRVGLSYINGTVVMPGEQFSLAGTLAPISTERGYVEAGVISNGRLVKGMGGGLSQVSTTVLNTAWFAGVQLDAFTPHSYYISRYPVGREATISVGQIDNQWTNDTQSPVVIQTWIEGDTIVMRFWGDRTVTVSTITGERRNIVKSDERTDDSVDCLPQHAEEGFDITVTRVLTRGGEEISRRDYSTRYSPSPEVVCTNPDAG